MKNIKMAVVMVAVIFLSVPLVANAGIGKNDCTVTSESDDYDIDTSIRRAENYFNRSGDYQGCRSTIGFSGVEAINLQYPLVFTGQPNNNVPTIGPAAGTLQLNIVTGSDSTKWPHPDHAGVISDQFGGKKCAIYIASTSNQIKLRNLVLNLNDLADYGICIKASDVQIENVKIYKPAQDGIFIGDNALGTSLGKGIVIVDANNGIMMENGELYSGQIGNLTDWSFIMREAGVKAINSTTAAVPVIGQVAPVGGVESGKLKVVVNVLSCEPGEGGQCADGSNPTAVPTSRLQIHKVIRGSVNYGALPTSFIRYSTAEESKSAEASGTFVLKIDTSAGATDGAANIKEIFLIPEMVSGQIGASTSAVQLVIGGTSVKVDPEFYHQGKYGVQSEQECLAKKGGWNYTEIENIDSDGDAIKDYLEDVNGNCNCDANESCYLSEDTDGDGLIDSMEDRDLNGYRACYVLQDKVGDILACSATVVSDCYISTSLTLKDPITNESKQVYELVPPMTATPDVEYFNLQADGSPANFDATKGFCTELSNRAQVGNDTDHDGLSDGLEDRSNRTLTGKGHFFQVIGTSAPQQYNNIECFFTGYATDIGMQFQWYVPTDTGDENPIGMYLQCRDDALITSDFNGSWDTGGGETNPLNPDTDLDGWCDGGSEKGGGSGVCVGLKGDIKNEEGNFEEQDLQPGDRCPSTWNLGNTCTAECYNGKIFDDMKAAVNTYNAAHPDQQITTNQVIAWTKVGSMENRAKLDVLGLPDSDSDFIPDILEQPNMSCMTGILGYSAFAQDGDTDGDGIKDNIDACPDSPAVGCTPDADWAYATSEAALIACYIDRDNDLLFDCEEDKNGDGKYESVKGETNGIIADTDGDGLFDGAELKNMVQASLKQTNPFMPDTDGDGLNDGTEVGYAGDPQVYESVLGTTYGCEAVKKADQKSDYDTDPTLADSDLDGITDGDEIKKTGTNPNNPDSDGDLLSDLAEDKDKDGIWPTFNGMIPVGVTEQNDYSDTNPCDSNTDHQGGTDKEEIDAGMCPANPDASCKYDAKMAAYGYDSDFDGLPDSVEDIFGTDKNDDDSDDDTILDGAEVWFQTQEGKWGDKFLPAEGESDPVACNVDETEVQYKASNIGGGAKVYYMVSLVGSDAAGTNNFCGVQVAKPCGADSDGDGMPDFAEYKYGTSPSKVDTDGDGIIDGIESGWLVAEAVDLENQMYRLKSSNGQFEYLPGSSYTHANNPQTDEDGLIDGYSNDQNYEDKNCNGRRDVSVQNKPLETDPRNANSDGDKWGDGEEFCWNGVCNGARAFTPQREGCANIGGTGGETWGMTIMFAVMLAATRVAVTVMRKTKRTRKVAKSS